MPTILDSATLDRIVRETLPPADGVHTFAAVATVDKDGVGVTVGFDKIAGKWEIDNETYFRHTWTGENIVGDRLVFKR